MITLSFTPEQAAKITTLYNAGFFDLRGSTATVEFDVEGTVMEIKQTRNLFKRGKRIFLTPAIAV